MLGYRNTAPQLSEIYFRSSTWTPQTAIAISTRLSLGAQTLPISQTGTTASDGIDQIDVLFTEPVNISTTDVRLRTSSTLNPVITADSVIANPDGNPLTHDYRLVFNSPLPSQKYVLEIDSTVSDLGGRLFDGEWNATYGEFDNYVDDVFTSAGDGSDGGDLSMRFAILYGDTNANGRVDAADKGSVDVNLDGSINQIDDDIIDAIIASGDTRLSTVRWNGDYVDNDVVDSADYLLWRSSYGATGANLPADGNGDGVVDAADYTVWRDNLGSASAWGPNAPAGPAPIVLFDEAPRVAEVTISGSASTHSPFVLSSQVGSGAQLTTVPVGGADTISITFTEDVNVSASDLELIGIRTANLPVLASFSYDTLTMTATWQFQGLAFGDNYLISLSDGVRDLDGERLDGEWTNPLSLDTPSGVSSTFPSGNGHAGGDFNFVVTLLPGDADLDGIVSSVDLSILSANYNVITSGGLFADADFDGDGDVDFSDFIGLANNWQTDLTTDLAFLADMDGDLDVDADDLSYLTDLNGDSAVDQADLDLFFAQLGASITAA